MKRSGDRASPERDEKGSSLIWMFAFCVHAADAYLMSSDYESIKRRGQSRSAKSDIAI